MIFDIYLLLVRKIKVEAVSRQSSAQKGIFHLRVWKAPCALRGELLLRSFKSVENCRAAVSSDYIGPSLIVALELGNLQFRRRTGLLRHEKMNT